MIRTLTINHKTGATEQIQVGCGSSKGARRLPARIGRALLNGEATATLEYDGRARRAVYTGSRYYMRLAA